MAHANVHVLPRPDGSWQTLRDGSKRAGFIASSQEEAIEAARRTAKREHVELIIHGRDGAIRSRDSFGNDPHPPRG